MPNNVDAEAAVLGSIIIDVRAADTLIPQLEADDFYLAQNRTIFLAMKSLQERSVTIDTVSVADCLDLQGKLDEVGSISYLGELAQVTPSAANAEYYLSILKRESLKRKVIYAGNDIVKYAYDNQEGKDALENAEKHIYKLAEQSTQKALVQVGGAVADAVNAIQDAQVGNVQKNVIQTGFAQFDTKTRGLKPGELVLIAARPSVGKTAFALNIAANVCLNSAKNVAIFSLEMPAELLAKRMLAYVSKVSITKMDRKGGMSSKDVGQLYKAYSAMLTAPLYIDDYSLNSPSDILSKCRRLKRESGLDLIIIDYLQLMSSGARSVESRQVEVSDMSRKMKIYAKELDCPIILLSQMSREVEKRDGHTPVLADLRESGSIEQDADIVAFLHNPSRYNPALPPNEVILDVKKNRNGPVGEIKLEWEGETTSFREKEADEDAQAVQQAQNSVIAQSAPTAPNQAEQQEVSAESVMETLAEASDSAMEDLSINAVPMPFSQDEIENINQDDDAPAPSDDDAPWDDDEYVDDDDDGDLDI